jgi:oxygen-independent coproporphyrinogen-3 oxidase
MDSGHYYVHVPFCVRRCNYCDFARVAGHADLHAPYFGAVVREISAAADADSPQCNTLYVGGGTPSCIDAAHLARVVEAIAETVGIARGAEITVECNPGSLTRTWARELMAAGVNRFSLGVQSLNHEELEHLGRAHRAAGARAAFASLRSLGCANVSVDLMYGLPGQTERSWRDSVAEVAGEWRPEHISFYALSIEPGSLFHLWRQVGIPRWSWPSGDQMMDWYWLASGLLGREGYQRYEISNFARPGFASRHNAAYWDTSERYLGFGAAAHSFWMVDGEKRRFKNIRTIRSYISRIVQGKAVRSNAKRLSKRQVLGEEIYLGLRREEGVALRPEHMAAFRGIVAGQVADGLVRRAAGGRIMLTRRGIELANQVMADYV